MKRDLSKLAQNDFDIAVIGGGIYGAVITYELARIGYKAAIIDKNDFSAATSANSFKIIHGGIRYLQDFDIKRMREFIYSRRYFLSEAPELVEVLPCAMLVQKQSKLKPFMYRVGLSINDLIAWDRNSGLPKEKTIPKSRFLNIGDIARFVPGIESDNYSGTIYWYDAVALDSERLVLHFIQKAVSHGAIAANYVKFQELHIKHNHVVGIKAHCQVSNKAFHIRAKTVINCTGPWVSDIARTYSSSPQPKAEYALAMNLVVEPFLSESFAVSIEGQGGYRKSGSIMNKKKRQLFFVPWHGKTMVGTYYRKYKGVANDLSISKDDISTFVHQIHAVYPAANITPDKICFYHKGLVPIRQLGKGNSSNFTLIKHTKIVNHEENGGPKGFISVDSSKYTTAAITAKKLIKHLAKKHPIPQTRKQATKTNCYSLDKPISSNQTILGVNEIRRLIRQEMTLTLGDIIFRRTNLGSLCNRSDGLWEFVARVMGKELKWDESRIVQEIESVRKYFLPIKELNPDLA